MLDTEEGRKSELAAVEGLLQEDLRNNSVWNHRWFVLHSPLAAGESLSDEVCCCCCFCCCCCYRCCFGVACGDSPGSNCRDDCGLVERSGTYNQVVKGGE